MASKFLSLRVFFVNPINIRGGSTILHTSTLSDSNLKKFIHASSAVCAISFFNKLPAEKLWKSVISVSNAGAKKGRGKGVRRKRAKDLNRGQVIGVGNVNILWPGLSAPVMKGRELVKQQKLPDDPERKEKLYKLRDTMNKFSAFKKLDPMDRGWSGNRFPGRSIGPPDPIGEDEFVGFETKVLEMKSLLLMKGNLGRTTKYSAFVVTGNGNGLAGFGLGKSKLGLTALRKAKNRAGQKLMHFELYNDHTIYHDFFCQFGKTKIYVSKKNEGYGLVCHRAIKCICEVVGIKDIYAKVEGSTNLQHIVKAFFLGLLQQKTHQQLADEKKLHLVEFRQENEHYPVVVASPKTVRTKEEIPKDETLDFNQYVMNDRVILRRKKFPKFYELLPSYEIFLKKLEKRRNHEKLRHNLKVEYGELKSFLNDKYPEETAPIPKE